MNFTQPIDEGFGRYLQRFHRSLMPTTRAMAEFAARDFAKAAVWAPGRLIDQADEMLDTWRKNDTSGKAQPTPFLPIMIAASSKDYIPAPPDMGRQYADPMWVQLPNDPKNRAFLMRAVLCEVRVQVAIFAPEKHTARGIAGQLAAFCQGTGNRTFTAPYRLAGVEEPWPVRLENPDIMSVAVQNDQKNLTILAADFTLYATVPMLMHPKEGDADADGAGTGTEDDPDGYLVVNRVDWARYAAADTQQVDPLAYGTIPPGAP